MGDFRMVRERGPRLTIIKREDVPAAMARPGFVPVCQYGDGAEIEEGEIGSIMRTPNKPPSLKRGLFVFESERLERIVLARN